MSNTSSILHAFQGFLNGNFIIHDHMSAKNVRQGQTDFMAWQQSARINRIVNFALFVRDMANDTPNPNKLKRRIIVKALSYPIPFALQIINHHVNGKYYPILKKSILFARNHVEHVALVVDIVATGYFAIAVAPIFGVGILAGLGFQVLLDSQRLPAKIRAVWEKSLIVIFITSLITAPFFYGGMTMFDLVFTIVDLGIFTYEHYFEGKKFKTLPKTQNMTLEKAQEIIDTPPSKLKVNQKHLNIRVGLQNNKDIDIIKSMKKLAEKIDWNKKNLASFKARLLADPRFQTKRPDINGPDGISDNYAKKLFHKGVNTLAKEISEHKIAKGDSFIRYDVLEEQLKAILNNLQDSSEDITDDFFTLAIDGGSYCASGKVRVIQELYKIKIESGRDAETKFLLWLYKTRLKWFERVFASLTQYANKLPKGIIDPSDQHFYNLALFYFDRPFKLYEETLKNDMSLAETGLCRHHYKWAMSIIFDFTFWRYFALKSDKWYSAEALIDAICEQSTLSLKTGEAEQKWWQDWINQLPDSPEKEKMDEDLIMFQILGKPLYDNTAFGQALNRDLVKLMLFNMGVLEKS